MKKRRKPNQKQSVKKYNKATAPHPKNSILAGGVMRGGVRF